jgi:hypothetical protein
VTVQGRALAFLALAETAALRAVHGSRLWSAVKAGSGYTERAGGGDRGSGN